MPPGGPHAYPPPPAAGTNGFAIASLILGILGGVLLSVVFGVVALGQIRKRPQAGRGLAIGGLVASGCWVTATVVIVAVAALTAAGESMTNDGTPSEAPQRDTVYVEDLKRGDCVNGLDETAALQELSIVSCSSTHEAEVYLVSRLAYSPSWPGAGAVQERAKQMCDDAFDTDVDDVGLRLDFLYVYPMEDSWPDDRGVTCAVVTSDGSTLTRSVLA
ncbi:DUF4190 domain-containing protein [Mangrovihabitans endophyticus]|nr:DUF4190 domain-containing protein [Mangrovihabitans endophyticus]